jgi:hypothetical protein
VNPLRLLGRLENQETERGTATTRRRADLGLPELAKARICRPCTLLGGAVTRIQRIIKMTICVGSSKNMGDRRMLGKQTCDRGSAGLCHYCRLQRFGADVLLDRSLTHFPPGTADENNTTISSSEVGRSRRCNVNQLQTRCTGSEWMFRLQLRLGWSASRFRKVSALYADYNYSLVSDTRHHA